MLGDDTLGDGAMTGILMAVNFLIIFCLYSFRNLNSFVERIMKVLVGIMILAFLANMIVVFSSPRSYVPLISDDGHEWLPLLAMIGTTFSVVGAFYHAYLVKQKCWGLHDIQKGVCRYSSQYFNTVTVNRGHFADRVADVLRSSFGDRPFFGRGGGPPVGAVVWQLCQGDFLHWNISMGQKFLPSERNYRRYRNVGRHRKRVEFERYHSPSSNGPRSCSGNGGCHLLLAKRGQRRAFDHICSGAYGSRNSSSSAGLTLFGNPSTTLW